MLTVKCYVVTVSEMKGRCFYCVGELHVPSGLSALSLHEHQLAVKRCISSWIALFLFVFRGFILIYMECAFGFRLLHV